MKKYLKKFSFALAILLMTGSVLTSCASKDESDNLADLKNSNNESEVDSESNKNNVNAVDSKKDKLDFTVDLNKFTKQKFISGASVHDPSIIKHNGKYYIFGSHMASASSDDLKSWTYLGNGYTNVNPVYNKIFTEGLGIFDYAGSGNSLIPTDDGGYHVWAPDVIFNPEMKKFMMYLSITSTWNTSDIALMLSDNIEGPYSYDSTLIYSGMTRETLEKTNVLEIVDKKYAESNYYNSKNEYNFRKYPNAIDPTLFFDSEARLWMVYGSFSGGMYVLEIDKNTGQVIHPEADEENRVDPYFGKQILGGGHASMEGPYIIYHPESEYYYLFVSYGGLSREGGYQMRVFRSKTPNGDYEDMNGKFPKIDDEHARFGLKLSGNYNLPSLDIAYMATGHNSVFIDEKDSKFYNVFHTRFDNGSEGHQVRVHQMGINEEGWPVMLPYQTNGETITEKVTKDKLLGKYYFINQGTKIDAKIAQAEVIYIVDDGKVYSKKSEGTWEITGEGKFIKITIDDVVFSGIMSEMKDQAEQDVTVLSLVGNNESVWCVSYGE